MESTNVITITVRVEANESMVTTIPVDSKDGWQSFNIALKNQFSAPVTLFKLQYVDDEGDIVTLTSQNEWEEMLRNGVKVVTISSPSKIEFRRKSLNLAGLRFYSWGKHDILGWIKHHFLIFDKDEKPIFNNTPLQGLGNSPLHLVEEVFEGFNGVSLSWSKTETQSHSGYCLFFHGSQLADKGKIYWPLSCEINCLVFIGWIEYPGQPRQLWKGAVENIEALVGRKVVAQTNSVQNQSSPLSPPLSAAVIKEAQTIKQFAAQLTQLFELGHRDVKKNLYLLQRFNGNLSQVIANL